MGFNNVKFSSLAYQSKKWNFKSLDNDCNLGYLCAKLEYVYQNHMIFKDLIQQKIQNYLTSLMDQLFICENRHSIEACEFQYGVLIQEEILHETTRYV